jgi:L,D-peptidoglycan transpeptidase YkuD (ErfK/YbiS/YcfS/YnhG family)
MLTLAVAALLTTCHARVEVVAPSVSARHAALSVWRCNRRVAGPWRARVGVNGLSAHHREGDGTTPLGTFSIGPVVYGLDPDPGLAFAYHRLTCGDWWDEDPRSPTYNSFRHLPCGAAPPFRGASEALWRVTDGYREFAVIDYNTAPTIPGRGSAIFLHVDRHRATNGCVSLPRPELLRVLRLLRPGATIAIRLA